MPRTAHSLRNKQHRLLSDSGSPSGVSQEPDRSLVPEWMQGAELARYSGQIRSQLGFSSYRYETIASSVARHIIPREIRTPDRIDAVVANIGILIMNDDPYRTIDAGIDIGERLLLTAYIDELRERMSARESQSNG